MTSELVLLVYRYVNTRAHIPYTPYPRCFRVFKSLDESVRTRYFVRYDGWGKKSVAIKYDSHIRE